MKNTKRIGTLVLSALMLTACGKDNGIGKEIVLLDYQLDCLTQLKAGTIDVAIIDSIMAGYYTSKGDYSSDLAIAPDLTLATEQYGIAGRKNDIAFMDKINEGLLGTFASNKMTEISNFFGVTSSLAINSTTSYTAKGTDNSWNSIVNSGKIIIGYTVFAPIAYEDSVNYSGERFTGYDIELARAVTSYLNTTYNTSLTLEFKEIDWDSKEVLLTNGTIDLIWNGLTITEERQANMAISIPYLNNSQVAVVKKADINKYKTVESLKDAIIGVEAGSAGEDVAMGK
ncbi:MAG: transporter substrate-binding domain-containing protein [Bacilli bacterium]|nr:transporter substrate-binding domain-containing protein [Bacilli bacterium]